MQPSSGPAVPCNGATSSRSSGGPALPLCCLRKPWGHSSAMKTDFIIADFFSFLCLSRKTELQTFPYERNNNENSRFSKVMQSIPKLLRILIFHESFPCYLKKKKKNTFGGLIWLQGLETPMRRTCLIGHHSDKYLLWVSFHLAPSNSFLLQDIELRNRFIP